MRSSTKRESLVPLSPAGRVSAAMRRSRSGGPRSLPAGVHRAHRRDDRAGIDAGLRLRGWLNVMPRPNALTNDLRPGSASVRITAPQHPFQRVDHLLLWPLWPYALPYVGGRPSFGARLGLLLLAPWGSLRALRGSSRARTSSLLSAKPECWRWRPPTNAEQKAMALSRWCWGGPVLWGIG